MHISARDIKGEICLLIEGNQDLLESSINFNNEIKDVALKNMSPSEAAKLLSLITKQNNVLMYIDN